MSIGNSARERFRSIALSRNTLLLAVVLSMMLAWGCRQDMHDQPRYTPLRAATFFEDGSSARQPVAGTVARGQLREDDHLYRGLMPGGTRTHSGVGIPYAESYPFEITRASLDRGQQRYDIFCSVCHDRVGNGNGMIVRQGFPQPPTLHSARLRNAPVGYFFDVISHGFGAMPDYASEITPTDRWRIIAYMRALQRSQNASLSDVPAEKKGDLERGTSSR